MSGAPGAPRPTRVLDEEEQRRRAKEKWKKAEKEKAEFAREKERKKLKEQRAKEDQKRLETVPMSSEPAIAAKRLETTELIVPYKFLNELPPLPSEPKLLSYEWDAMSYVRYRYDSSIEINHKYEMLAEPDLGIMIDLVDQQGYDAEPGVSLAPEDEELLKSGSRLDTAATKKHVVNQIREDVTWLRRTPILGNNLYEQLQQAKEHGVTDTQLQETSLTLEEKIVSIEKQFAEAAELETAEGAPTSTLRHPTNPDLRPMQVLPVLPDFKSWENAYVQMVFDVDPSLEEVKDLEVTYSRSRVGKALVKGFAMPAVAGGASEQYVAYMLPGEGDEGEGDAEESALQWVREYKYQIGNNEDCYFLSMQPDCVAYNEFSSKIALKRKAFRQTVDRPSAISLARREVNEEETSEMSNRRQRLCHTSQLRLTHNEE